MLFSHNVDIVTAFAAFGTLKAVNPGRAPSTFEAFAARVAAARYIEKPAEELVRHLRLQNFATHRLAGETPTQMFPRNDRPRGRADIAALKYLKSAPCVSPVVVLKDGRTHTLLDGVHRILAAKLAGSPVRACVVGVPVQREQAAARLKG